MKKSYFISCLIFICCFAFGTEEANAFSNQYQFTIPSRGIQYYEVRVPEGAKQIKAVLSGQTQMVNLALYGPGKDVPSSKNSTWSNLSNWKKPLHCSVGIVPNRSGQGPGIWRVKVEGAVHIGKVDKIKSVSGLLNIYVEGVPATDTSSNQKVNQSSYPLIKEYQFTVPSRGIKYYEVRVPEGAKRIKAVLSGQTQMVNLALYGPGKDVPSCKTTTWSNMSNWGKPLHCSVGIVPNRSGQGLGIWRVKVEGAVHIGKVDKIKSVSGLLTIRVDGDS